MRDAAGKVHPAMISGAGAKKGYTLTHDGVRWKAALPTGGVKVSVQTTAPASPAVGDFWYDTDATC